MSLGATAGQASPRATGAGSAAGDAPRLEAAGLLFARLTVAPALLAAAWLLAGFVLLLAGRFSPVPVFAGSAALAIPLLYYGCRAVPGLPGTAVAPRGAASAGERASLGSTARTPWWTLAAVAVIVAAFAAYQAAYHSQFVIVYRDPGSYFQFGTWLARHGSLPIPEDTTAFGGTHGGAVTFASYAYYQVGGVIQPQFMAGLPMVLAGAMWLGGSNAALLAAPACGALALLAFAGLAARLIGARWAVLAVAAAAVTLPQQFTSRSDYSEPLTEILFLSGLCLVLDALREVPAGGAPSRHGRRARGARNGPATAAALGGLALGITVLVRIDGASDILLTIPFCGALFALRKPQALPLAAGFAVGAALGLIDAVVFAWPYMVTNASSVVPLAGITAVLVVATAAVAAHARYRGLPRWDRRSRLVRLWHWLADASVVLAFAVMAVFALRPHFQHVYGATPNGKVKPDHAELSLHWVWWYIGIPAVGLATLGAGVLIRRCMRGQARDWVLPLLVFTWCILEFLYRPAITPDQPWASRRLVPAVLPGFILFATWAIAWAVGWVRRLGELRGYPRLPRSAAVGVTTAAGALLIVVPAAVANWGVGVTAKPGGGLRLTLDGLATRVTYAGELTAMQRLCADLPRDATVIIVNGNAMDHLMENIRGMCGVPVGSMVHAAHAVVKSVVADIEKTGRAPVILGESKADLRPYAHPGVVRQVMSLRSTMDPSTLYSVPRYPRPNRVFVWTWQPLPAQGHAARP